MQVLPNTDVRQETLCNIVRAAGTLLHKISESKELFSGASDATKEGLPNNEQNLLRSIGRIIHSALCLVDPAEYTPTLKQLAATMSEKEKEHFTNDYGSLPIEDPKVNAYCQRIKSNLHDPDLELIRKIFLPVGN